MAETNQKKSKEWQAEERHLKECRALIAANVAEYERQLEERRKETKALFDEVQSGNVELYDQLVTSRSLEEHSFNQLHKTRRHMADLFLEELIIKTLMKNFLSLFISVSMVFCGIKRQWRLWTGVRRLLRFIMKMS